MRPARPLLVAAVAALGLLPACRGSAGPEATPRAAPSRSPAASPTPTASPAAPSPDPSPSVTPDSPAEPLRLGPGAPKVYRRPVPASQVPAEALIPSDGRLGRVLRLPATTAAPEQIVVVWSRGGDPFRQEHGLSIWEASAARPPWRAVAGFYDSLREEVLGIRLQAGDLTADGHPDLLSFELRGGSGGCGTWRVFASRDGTVEELFRRDTCDAEIVLADGTLQVASAVFEPGDSHCCPSFTRRSTLRWNGERWARVASELIPNPAP